MLNRMSPETGGFNPEEEIEKHRSETITRLQQDLEDISHALKDIPAASDLLESLSEAYGEIVNKGQVDIIRIRGDALHLLEYHELPEEIEERINNLINELAQFTSSEKLLKQNFETIPSLLEKRATRIAERIAGLSGLTEYLSFEYIGKITWVFLGIDYEQGMNVEQQAEIGTFIELLEKYKKELEEDVKDDEDVQGIRSLEKTIAMVKKFQTSMSELGKSMINGTAN